MAQNFSRKLSFVGENIRKIRQVKKISQAELAAILNLARPSIGAYEEGRSEPKIEAVIQIANYFRISIDALLTRELTVSEIYSIGVINQKLDKAHQLEAADLQRDLHGRMDHISLVYVNHYLDYVVSHRTIDFIKSLPRLNLPVGNAKDIYRAFEMNGSEMEYHQQGLHHGDILLGRQVKPIHNKTILNRIVTIVHKEGITTRRVFKIYPDAIGLKSDDPNYPDENINIDYILETWIMEGAFSKYLNAPTFLEERVLKLEKAING